MPRRLGSFLAIAAATAAASWAAAADVRTYALVGAIGSRFEVMTSKQQTGSHIPAFDRQAYAVNGNVLNRLALQGLDQAVARHEPESRPARPALAALPVAQRR